MINIRTDEGYAFDYLAILEVKKNLLQQEDNWINCFNFLKSQFDENIWNIIINSKEYNQLVDVNTKTFHAVNQARYGDISAKEVDNCNMERYLAKQNFQLKFFPFAPTTEYKN
jgi:hypothetical protein